ncbi:histone H4 transcription factor-like isoform X2 [Homarus americanus]|nr:histone H4 transcription factor-like isoform X2 [Homarus americanus]XP_042222727.1 histone H4 transcription factor-like isoform X2 [Homarus americanus]XP_042222737.1 histone H4 transcription factor-like isoform X2 [Homarus americanus]XP_042222742.1 histone H4 transcription factor-like isoform X2 [Homarus americanus]
MTRKRKLSEMDDVEWGGMEDVTRKDPLQSALELNGIHTVFIVDKTQEQVVNDNRSESQTDERTSESSEEKKKSSTKIKKISGAMRLKQMSLNCEWNMCTAVYKKMERFIFHIADHLAVTEPPSGDGHLCHWRDCWFVCNTKEELDRHVYFHAFHTKTKSMGKVLMEERQEQCMLDNSGRNMIPEIPEAFQCMWEDCDLRFASAQDFYWHVHGHVRCVDSTGETKKEFLCSWEGCAATFILQSRLRDHSRSHTQEKVVGCPNCGGIYASNTKFYDHCTRQIPLYSQQYQCSHCSRKFANERLLRDHVRHHINHFKCNECDMTCPNKSALAVHVRYRHSTERPHKCLQCGRGFTGITDLSRHLSVHSEEPPYPCPDNTCEFKCRATSTLNRHIKTAHNGLRKDHYACHMCNSKFNIGILLTRHLIKEHSFHSQPVGHTRFRYKQDDDGFYRLQTVRYESIEQTQEMSNEDEESMLEEQVDSPPSSSASQISKADRPTQKWIKDRESPDDWGTLDPHKLLNLKNPTSQKLGEYEDILLPSQF